MPNRMPDRMSAYDLQLIYFKYVRIVCPKKYVRIMCWVGDHSKVDFVPWCFSYFVPSFFCFFASPLLCFVFPCVFGFPHILFRRFFPTSVLNSQNISWVGWQMKPRICNNLKQIFHQPQINPKQICHQPPKKKIATWNNAQVNPKPALNNLS